MAAARIALLGKQGGEEKQDFFIHHFSQLLTKPPALQAPSSPELEAFRQPARAFAPSPGSLQGNLPDDSEQTVVRAFLPHKGQIFLSAHLHQGLSRRQKLKDRQTKALEATEMLEPWQSQEFCLDSCSVMISQQLASTGMKGKLPPGLH